MGKKEKLKCEGDRLDQTWHLGKELSSSEERCYRIICASGITPINNEQISRQFYSNQTIIGADEVNIWTIVYRIRRKLGKEEIIGREGFGYVSRRMMINEMVEKNKKNRGC